MPEVFGFNALQVHEARTAAEEAVRPTEADRYLRHGHGGSVRSHRKKRVRAQGTEKFFRKGAHAHNSVWSPDGQWIYFTKGPDPFSEMDVWRVRPTGESPEQLTHQNSPVNFLALLDSRTLLSGVSEKTGVPVSPANTWGTWLPWLAFVACLRHAREVGRRTIATDRLGEAKVKDLDHAVRRDLDVRGLQVAMDDPLLVRGFQRLGDLLRNGERLIEGNRAAGGLLNPLFQKQFAAYKAR